MKQVSKNNNGSCFELISCNSYVLSQSNIYFVGGIFISIERHLLYSIPV